MPAESSSKQMGRPLKYLRFISRLDDDTCYTPARIVREGIELGLVTADPELLPLVIKRIRHTLARYAKNHEFPLLGDGLVVLSGQFPTVGWFGKRWKQAMLPPTPCRNTTAEDGP